MQTKRQETEQRSRIRQRLAGAAVLFLFCGFSYSSYASMDVRHRNGSSQIPVLKSRYFPVLASEFLEEHEIPYFSFGRFSFLLVWLTPIRKRNEYEPCLKQYRSG